ncbi:40810_t:CDS:10 [Gigaspora margarita]|uniref:40810_t:CDS:1 n=1 Tax=Gigaspora margarita TaxID=4874 RepID=A0ABN7UNN5_GIGMA|nr:40810_t:CDS:10 [Gigaspora margarita]
MDEYIINVKEKNLLLEPSLNITNYIRNVGKIIQVKRLNTQYEDTFELDINYLKFRKINSATSLYDESTIVEGIDDDSNNMNEVSQESQDSINMFLLHKWNLHKGLRVHGNTFVYGKEIHMEDGTITPNKARQPALQKIFEKYDDYIAKEVIIGGALSIKSICPKDRKSNLHDFDILKANFYWINDQIITGQTNVFSQVSYDNIFTIKDMNDDKRITTGYELKAWIKDIFEHQKGYIIAFNKIIPANTLLKNEIKQEIIRVCGKFQYVDNERMIVPYIANFPISEFLNNWIYESSPTIYLCHWINDLYIFIMDKSYMYLRQPISKKDAFTLANHIKFDKVNITKIPFLAESLTNLHPIFDNNDKLRPSEKFLKAINNALDSNYPFCNLKNIFDKFGYFCPQSIILGKTFSKIDRSDNNGQLVNNEHVDFNMDQDESKTIKEKLIKWNESTKHLDISFFLDFIIDPLQDNNYEIFGWLLINGQKAPDVMIQFNLANQYGCRATIHKLDNTSVVVEAQVFWMVLAKGHGYFSRRSRDIKITYEKKTLTGKLPINVEISLPSWLDSCIFVIGFDLEDLDKPQVIKSEHNYRSKSVLNINVFQYNSEVILENVTIRWCFIDINPEDLITIDVGEKVSNLFKWNIFGDVMTRDVITGHENFGSDYSVKPVKLSSINKNYERRNTHLKEEIVENVIEEPRSEAIKPFIPLISSVELIISEIIVIYENARYNKKICNSLMDRVGVAEQAVKFLQRRKAENERHFRNVEYYKNFVRFVDVLKRIKEFIKNVSELKGYRKFVHSRSIKQKFENIVKEFETVIGDLHFTISVANEEQRKLDHEALEQDISDMNKFLDQIKGGIVDNTNTLNTVLQEVLIMKSQIEHISDIKPVNINPDDLLDPEETDRRGTKPNYIYKKIYKFCEVACKPIVIPKDYDIKAQRFYVRFAILGKLRESPNILKFFGLSYLEGNIVMVNEWTEMGTLREVYEKYDIAWFVKVHIATDICRGITFLHSCDILHHDIRCENILMTRNLEPKITKFEYSSYVNRDEGLFKMTNDNVFGMTLWELVFEKIPYGHWDIGKIIDYVISGKREQISFRDAPEDIQRLQQELKLIIISAWQDDPELRASLQQIFLQLSTLARIYQKPLSSPALLPPNTLDLDGSKKKIYDSSNNEGDIKLPDLGNEFAIEPIMPLEEGILAHKRKDAKTARECFEAHAELDRKRASELYKETADGGISDAQLRYAFSLVNNPPIKFDRAIFLDYLNKAAENNNPTAQFNLGDMYLN